jgi:uncharacterized integral membrane protein (TIGR00698 family)
MVVGDGRTFAWTLLANAAAGLLPGVLLAAGVAGLALIIELAADTVAAQATGRRLAVPAAVFALVIGIAAHRIACRPVFQDGVSFCAATLLKVSVAMLGLRIAVGDLSALGAETAILVPASMAMTIAICVAIARWLGCPPEAGAMMGAANAICGASATLAAAAALPSFSGKQTAIVLTVVMANAASTVAMILYPLLAQSLGLSPVATGLMLGASIHDVAQVAGAGLGLSDAAANTAITVKMYRVLLLLPAVIVICWWFRNATADGEGGSRPGIPGFAVAFAGLAVLNGLLLADPVIASHYQPVRKLLIEASSVGLLVSIAALGLKTSLPALRSLGVRPVAVFAGGTVTMLLLSIAIAARAPVT